jgi:hypothetical protein
MADVAVLSSEEIMYRFHATLLCTSLAALTAGAADKPEPIADKEVATFVDAKVKERQPPAADRRFDAVGWSTTVLDALKLAKEHNRPVFLFTHDGRMNLGRC